MIVFSEPTHFFTRHLSPFYNRIADNWKLGRLGIAAAENKVGGGHGTVASSDGHDHQTRPFIAA